MEKESKESIQKRIDELEHEMGNPGFWDNKISAQTIIKEVASLKEKLLGVGKYDKGDAIMTIFSGAGGDDSEDFSRILFEMYVKYINHQKWDYNLIHENKNDHGGYRNITLEINGKNAYGTLKNESGVHRLVRISPFNAKQLRHTSFSMVEVIPKFDKINDEDMEIPEKDLKIEFSKSSGPGGQNVNKRETAVRIVHLPTNTAVHVDSLRSQEQNRAKAIAILKGKLYKRREEERLTEEKGMYISKTTDIEWGNQIRSYVFHPYKMIKDHRTDFETRNIEKVLDGELEEFIEAEKNL